MALTTGTPAGGEGGDPEMTDEAVREAVERAIERTPMSFHCGVMAVAIAFACAVPVTTNDRPQSASRPAGTSTIAGSIVTLSSREPIADASVTLYASMFPDGRTSTRSDGQGRFQFSSLPPGHYTVGAEKAGFVRVTFGERLYGRGGRAIPLRDGERRDLQIQLPHGNVITGRIVDERGDPAVGTSVRALQFSMATGYRSARSVGAARTNGQGVFRIASLTPGDYVVCAATSMTAPLNDAQRLQMDIDRQRRNAAYVLGPGGIEAQRTLAPRLAALEARLPAFVPPVRGYAPMCYPGATASPSTITLLPDEKRTGVDMQLVPTRLARIEGIVKGIPAEAWRLDPIGLFSGDEFREGMGQDGTRVGIDGRFTFTNVSPGRYRLFVRGVDIGAAGRPPVRAEADVVVGDEDLHDVVLDLQPGSPVSGRVVFRGSVPPPTVSAIAGAELQVRLAPVPPGPLTRYPGPSTGRVDATTGQFVLRDVFPGEYKISMFHRELTGWFFDSATIAGRDVTGQPVHVTTQGLTGVTVTMTNQRAELSGTIMTDTGNPAREYYILVYPADERNWHQPHILGARANEDGTYLVRGLRRGTYHLATILDAEFGAWFDPAYLRRIDAGSRTLSFAGEERKTLHLRVPDDR
jgi:hypothetical protein